MPDLQSVHGTVTNGRQPLANATVVLVPDDAAQAAAFTVSGVTDEQGNYTISTLEARHNRKRPGAPEGNYRVVVTLPVNADQSGGSSYEGFGKVTVGSGDNSIPPIDVSK
jgi:hypothetical protein